MHIAVDYLAFVHPIPLWIMNIAYSYRTATDVKRRSGPDHHFRMLLSHRDHRVMRDPLLIEREPESGSIGYFHRSVSFDGERFAEHLVAAEQRKPARRIMGKLEKRTIRN